MSDIAVLSGGRSSEHEISLLSGASVAAGLREAGFNIVEVLIDRDGIWTVDGRPVRLDPASGLVFGDGGIGGGIGGGGDDSGDGIGRGESAGVGERIPVDVDFPALHGPFGEDGTVQGALEMLGLPYVGSGVLASSLCMDKLSLKRLFAGHSIDQVDFVAAGEDGWRDRVRDLGLPVWVKPSRLGSSVGIQPVHDLADLDSAVAEAAAYDPRVIVEAGAAGMEVECAILGNADSPREEANLHISQPGALRINADWYDFEAKYTAGGMDLEVPAPIPAEAATRMRELAARAFRLSGCAGLARCDFFVEPDGRVLLSEINTMPGFTPTSVYSRLLETDGITYPDLCRRLVELALDRRRSQADHTF